VGFGVWGYVLGCVKPVCDSDALLVFAINQFCQLCLSFVLDADVSGKQLNL